MIPGISNSPLDKIPASLQLKRFDDSPQKQKLIYDKMLYPTPQMIQVAAQLRIPWKFDTDASLEYDSEAYEHMRRYPTVAAKTDEALIKIAGTDYHMYAESDQGLMFSNVMSGILSRIHDFQQRLYWVARSYVDGKSWLQILWKKMVFSVGDDKPRQWWVPYRLIPVHKSQFVLRNEPYFDKELNEDNMHYFWVRINPVNMQPFVVNQEEYLISTMHGSHLTWDYGEGKYDKCFPTWRFATKLWTEMADAIESVLFPAIGVGLDAGAGVPIDFSGDQQMSGQQSNQAYAAAQAAAMRQMRNFGMYWFNSTDKIQMIDRDGGGLGKVLDLLRYLEQKMSEILTISITPGGGYESKNAPGSLASSQVGASITDDALSFYRKALVEEVIQKQLVARIYKYNKRNFLSMGLQWADRAQFKIGVPDKTDAARTLNGIQMLLGKLPISKSWLYEFYGVEAPKTEGDEFKLPQEPEPMADDNGGGENMEGTPMSPENIEQSANPYKKQSSPKERIQRTVSEMSAKIKGPLGFEEWKKQESLKSGRKFFKTLSFQQLDQKHNEKIESE